MEATIQPVLYSVSIETRERLYMSAVSFSHEEIVREAKFSPEDMTEIKKRRL